MGTIAPGAFHVITEGGSSMWLWKQYDQHPPQPPLQESILSREEIAQLLLLRQDLFHHNEYLLTKERQRLLFLRWLVEQGKLSGDTTV